MYQILFVIYHSKHSMAAGGLATLSTLPSQLLSNLGPWGFFNSSGVVEEVVMSKHASVLGLYLPLDLSE